MGDWTPDHTAMLKKLWKDGLSAAAIGTILGMSRNAIIGKKTRLRLEKRPQDTPKARRQRTRSQTRFEKARVTVAAVLPPLPPSLAVDHHNKGIDITALAWHNGNPSNCRAIIRHDKTGYFYCGNPNEQGESFCAGHCKLYFTPARASRARADYSVSSQRQ